MPRLSTYPALSSIANNSDLVPITSGGGTQNIPVENLIREPFVSVGGSSLFCDYVCDGIADDIELNAAIQYAKTKGKAVLVVSPLTLSNIITLDPAVHMYFGGDSNANIYYI